MHFLLFKIQENEEMPNVDVTIKRYSQQSKIFLVTFNISMSGGE